MLRSRIGEWSTGSQQGWWDSSVHGNTEYQSTEMRSWCELVMETESKEWYVSRARMSSSSLDGLPGSFPLVFAVSWQSGDRGKSPGYLGVVQGWLLIALTLSL